MKRYAGTVTPGTKAASSLGFPTVNIACNEPGLSGVYVANVITEEKSCFGAAFADQARKILEVHLLDFSGELYGAKVEIELLEKIRDREHFPNEATAKAMITRDIERVREYVRKQMP